MSNTSSTLSNLTHAEFRLALIALASYVDSRGLTNMLERQKLNQFLRSGSGFWKHAHISLPEVRYALVGLPVLSARDILEYVRMTYPKHQITHTSIAISDASVAWMESTRDTQMLVVGREITGSRHFMVQEAPTSFPLANAHTSAPPKDICF